MGKRILQIFIVILLLLSALIIYSYIMSQKEQPIYCSYDGSFGQYANSVLNGDIDTEGEELVTKVYVDSSELNAPENLLVIAGKGGNEYYYKVEIADTEEKQALGLMYREKLDKRSGMLFIFPEPKPATFWMKNTYIPLDLLFIDETGKVVDMYENAEPESEEYLHTQENVKAVLEINAGEAKEMGVEIGTKIYHDIFDVAELEPVEDEENTDNAQ